MDMKRAVLDVPGLHHGVYSYHEAARLLNVASQRVSRWADGYSYQLKYGRGKSRPVLQTDRHKGVLTFDELWELFFVREYIAVGVTLQHVRATAESLAKQFGPHPFANADLIIHGRQLLIQCAEDMLQRPDVGQLVADFAATLEDQIVIRKKEVGRYMPRDFDNMIYLDKTIRGGEAVVTDHAIPTRTVYGLWTKEGDLASVADYFDIDLAAVSVAVRYEGQWRLSA
jgi:uncharacterized protein (DUF433 family)